MNFKKLLIAAMLLSSSVIMVAGCTGSITKPVSGASSDQEATTIVERNAKKEGSATTVYPTFVKIDLTKFKFGTTAMTAEASATEVAYSDQKHFYTEAGAVTRLVGDEQIVITSDKSKGKIQPIASPQTRKINLSSFFDREAEATFTVCVIKATGNKAKCTKEATATEDILAKATFKAKAAPTTARIDVSKFQFGTTAMTAGATVTAVAYSDQKLFYTENKAVTIYNAFGDEQLAITSNKEGADSIMIPFVATTDKELTSLFNETGDTTFTICVIKGDANISICKASSISGDKDIIETTTFKTKLPLQKTPKRGRTAKLIHNQEAATIVERNAKKEGSATTVYPTVNPTVVKIDVSKFKFGTTEMKADAPATAVEYSNRNLFHIEAGAVTPLNSNEKIAITSDQSMGKVEFIDNLQTDKINIMEYFPLNQETTFIVCVMKATGDKAHCTKKATSDDEDILAVASFKVKDKMNEPPPGNQIPPLSASAQQKQPTLRVN